MTIQQALELGFRELRNNGIRSYQLDCEILLTKTLLHTNRPDVNRFLDYAESINRTKLFSLSRNYEITKSQLKIFTKLIQQRAKRVPVAYLTNIKHFYNLPFYVDERVLIPRPHTELLVGRVVQMINPDPKSGLQPSRRRKTNNLKDNITIIDIGTGSGCIIVSIAKEILHRVLDAKTKFIATDTSKPALIVARQNAQTHGISDNIRFIKTATLPIVKTQHCIIVANLPYLDPAIKYKLIQKTPELHYEPQKALFANNQGLEHYQSLIQQLKPYQKKHINVTCFFEIDPHQRAMVSTYTQDILNCRTFHQNGVFTFSL